MVSASGIRMVSSQTTKRASAYQPSSISRFNFLRKLIFVAGENYGMIKLNAGVRAERDSSPEGVSCLHPMPNTWCTRTGSCLMKVSDAI
jgi:hypothetical protein